MSSSTTSTASSTPGACTPRTPTTPWPSSWQRMSAREEISTTLFACCTAPRRCNTATPEGHWARRAGTFLRPAQTTIASDPPGGQRWRCTRRRGPRCRRAICIPRIPPLVRLPSPPRAWPACAPRAERTATVPGRWRPELLARVPL